MSVPARLAGKNVRCGVCKEVFAAADLQVTVEEEDEPRRSRRRDGFRCVHCGSRELPEVLQRTRTEGWVAFVVLSIITVPVIVHYLGWGAVPLAFLVSSLALLMKEDYRVCSDCGIRLG
jgi:hypothetical protein